MRTHTLHMTKAQNSPGTPAGESRRTWRAYRPRQLARVGGGSAAARVARLREYHVCDQHAEGRVGTRSLHRAVPFLPHRDFRVFIVRPRSWVRKVLQPRPIKHPSIRLGVAPGGPAVAGRRTNAPPRRTGVPATGEPKIVPGVRFFCDHCGPRSKDQKHPDISPSVFF